MIGYHDASLAAEEPCWLILPDDNLVAFFRDNRGSGSLFRGFSIDEGQTWTKPVRTNFPDSKSKFSGLKLKDGRYVLVSNPNPKQRDPLTLAVSDDGLVFHSMGYLVGGRHIDYPHVIEHEGALYVAFAGAKQTVEVLRTLRMILVDLDALGHAVDRHRGRVNDASLVAMLPDVQRDGSHHRLALQALARRDAPRP